MGGFQLTVKLLLFTLVNHISCGGSTNAESNHNCWSILPENSNTNILMSPTLLAYSLGKEPLTISGRHSHTTQTSKCILRISGSQPGIHVPLGGTKHQIFSGIHPLKISTQAYTPRNLKMWCRLLWLYQRLGLESPSVQSFLWRSWGSTQCSFPHRKELAIPWSSAYSCLSCANKSSSFWDTEVVA